ncbi:MAG: DMT family transporter [Acidobacteriota bacterium]|jgi:drug/metabolite transporter (DMT)-like permease
MPPMTPVHAGETAALAASVLWAFTAIFFTQAGARIGSVNVNRIRLVIAVVLLGLSHWFVSGSPLPLHAGGARWLWLGLSGLVGLVIGDSFLFQSYLDLGPRKASLVFASWPIISSFLAWLLLDEVLTGLEIGAIVLTVGSISWVVRERQIQPQKSGGAVHPVRGLFFALGGAAGQALGVVLAKKGLEGNFSPLTGTLIRMIVAAGGIWLLSALRGRLIRTLNRVWDARGLGFTFLGAVAGPFLGVWMSLIAVSHAKVGIASALMTLAPVWLLPMVWLIYREKLSWRAVIGTLFAMIGVWGLFMF